MKYLHSNIKLLREYNKLTHRELSDILKVSRNSITGYEDGTTTPKIKAISKMAKLFGVTIDHLLGFDLFDVSINDYLKFIKEEPFFDKKHTHSLIKSFNEKKTLPKKHDLNEKKHDLNGQGNELVRDSNYRHSYINYISSKRALYVEEEEAMGYGDNRDWWDIARHLLPVEAPQGLGLSEIGDGDILLCSQLDIDGEKPQLTDNQIYLLSDIDTEWHIGRLSDSVESEVFILLSDDTSVAPKAIRYERVAEYWQVEYVLRKASQERD